MGVSLDGLAPLHDKVRNVPGSFDRAVDTLRRARAAGLAISVNTQIGAQTMPDLPALMDTIIELGATHWQIQLTVAMGNAVDNDALLLQPYQLQELMPLLARLYKEGVSRGLLMNVGNNIGYYGPYEHLWRGFGDERVHWNGCAAGQTVIALEADGTVKGCPHWRRWALPGQCPRPVAGRHLAHQRGHPLRPPALGGRSVGLLPDLLLRRCLPGRLHLDLAFAARQAGQ